MRAARGLLVANGVLFLLFGAAFLSAPAAFSATLLGATPASASALVDLRATYGGLGLGAGWAFLYCARAAPRLGLVWMAALLGAIALGRGVGIALDGGGPLMVAMWLAEAGFAVAAGWSLRRVGGAVANRP